MMVPQRLSFIFVLFFSTVIFFNSCNRKNNASLTTRINENSAQFFPENKPWTRWWWHGSSVSKTGITSELEALSKKGFGGVELTPIYGVRGEESKMIQFLSEEWMQLFTHTLVEARRLGLGVDMATGTGWPFGGPWVSEEDAPKYLTVKNYNLGKDESFTQNLNLLQEPILRMVRPGGIKIDDLKYPVTANENLQALAIDQVRYKIPYRVSAVLVYQNGLFREDISYKLDSSGNLNFKCNKEECTVYVVYEGNHGKMVERAAPGGEGNVIDHFSSSAITKYLEKFDKAFEKHDISHLRAFFNDSYEVDDASGQANWTSEFFSEFEKRRGYNLKKHIPALIGMDNEEKNDRVLSDYRETISDLMLDHFLYQWNNWANKYGKITRNQAHGSPANILDLYAASGIPETEGTDIIKIKMASSPAHVTGQKLVAAEAATWLGEHFVANLGDLKENVDRYFAGGVNHIVYHGTCYSPKEDQWPGRLFYASIHANSRNPEWQNFEEFNNYVTRVQSFLQKSKTLNDVLLYFPVYDRFSAKKKDLLDHFDGMAHTRGGTSRVREIAEKLYTDGYSFDFISDKQIQEFEKKMHDYKVIIIPETKYFNHQTLEKLAALANKGVTIIFDKTLPKEVNGYLNKDTRAIQFTSLKESISKNKNIEISNDINRSLGESGISPEEIKKSGADFIRKSVYEKVAYFITNWSGKTIDQWIKFEYVTKNAVIYDPLSGDRHATRNSGEKVRIRLNKGESIILFTDQKQDNKIKNAFYDVSEQPPLQLNELWNVSFIKGGNTDGILPTGIAIRGKPVFWTELNKNEYDCFSGTVSYETKFNKPGEASQYWLLDLGEVKESAKIFLNGKKLATTFGPVHQVKIHNTELTTNNTLIVEVSNSMANRIICLEKKGVYWQKFYNINMSAKEAKNLNKDRIFTAINWAPLPSGLKGPVTLRAIR